MKISKQIFIFLGSVILMICSCSPAYIPNVVNTPLLSNKGEVQAAVHVGVSGVDPQFAYALTDQIGLMLNGSFLQQKNNSTNTYYKYKFTELGVGYYSKIGDNGRFETFGGFGLGNIKTNSTNSFLTDGTVGNISTRALSYRAFIQPTIGLSYAIFDGSFTTRLVMVNISEKSLLKTDYFAEPTFTVKLGYKYVKYIFQFGLSIPLYPSYRPFKHQVFIFSVGMRAAIFRDY